MIKAELLQDANDAMVRTLLTDNNYVWQEKHNGDRRIISKEGNVIQDFNRDGERGKGLSPKVIKALQDHPAYKFVIDVEYVGHEDKLYLFDVLYMLDEVVLDKPYSTRLSYLHASFDQFVSSAYEVVYTAKTPQEKLALYEKLRDTFAEGFVMKDVRAQYRPSDGNRRWNYRYKFIKTLDAVVIGDSTERDDKGMLKNSVRLGLYMPNGFLKDICGATKKSRYKLEPGDVVELIYLYGTPTFDVVQPRISPVGKRTDKAAKDCTIDQIVVNKNWRKR